MKTYKINVEVAWDNPHKSGELYNFVNKVYTVKAKSLSDAESIAEDKAMNDTSFNLGRPDYVCCWIVGSNK